MSERRIVRFTDLNWLGKAAFLAGATVRLTASAIDATLERVADIAVEAEAAFRDELDPNVEDANILEERDRDDP
ncbi:MAG: hypothetical protein AAF970_12720 [Bacteroidota bacterium]